MNGQVKVVFDISLMVLLFEIYSLCNVRKHAQYNYNSLYDDDRDYMHVKAIEVVANAVNFTDVC